MSHLLLFVTSVCLVCWSVVVAWTIAVMAMFAGVLSTVTFGGIGSTRWWRATLNAWIGLLLLAGLLFHRAASIFVVEVLWITGLSALLIGTWAAVSLRS